MSQHQKTPLSRTLSAFTKRKALDEIAELGLALPGHVTAVAGAIVTVAFDVSGVTIPEVMMPLAGSIYVRLPIQVGDKGFAIPADAYLGGVSGLGGGTADLKRRANLSTLAWLPVGNSEWAAVNADYVVVQGPNGVQLQDLSGAVVATFDKANGVSVTFGSGSITMNSSSLTLAFGGKSIVINSSGVTIDGILFDTHQHGGVTVGSGVTAGPQA